MNMSMNTLVKPLILAGLCFAAPASAQGPSTPAIPLAEPALADVLDITTDRTDRMTVPVHIGGQGPYPFIVDTGAERTVISRELATRLKLDPSGTANLHSMTGESSVEMVMIPSLGVSSGSVKDIRAPALSRAHMGAPGLLGIDSLKTQRVLMDFKRQTMTLTPSKQREEKWDPDTIVVTARSRFGQLILVDASANGHKINVILDTGSQVSVGNEALRRKLFGKNPKKRPVQVELVSVTGGRMTADYTFVEKIKIGGVTLTEMPIAFANVHPFKKLGLLDKPAIMLGMDALSVFERVSVDFANKRVRFLIDEGGGRDDALMVALDTPATGS